MPLIGTFTRRPAKMPLLDLEKMTAGLSKTWSGFLRDWDRSLRAGNYPETTRYNYLLAAAQLARFLREYSPDPDADAAAGDPVEVTRAHVEAFQAWMIETRSASTALKQAQGAAAVLQVADAGRGGDRPVAHGRGAAAEAAAEADPRHTG
ncbi:phage integrase N-terminal SAM-like domain-containing protein [Streptomyces sp. NPDC127197]|uniref:phage integrase N-terminal SAM-like domain-containing protein n=1 Tax=Streptomyces sp. NPDC127197 TaxID=3345388 RepID=UPI003627EF24